MLTIKINELSSTKLDLLKTCYYAIKYANESSVLRALSIRDIEETCCCGSDEIKVISTGISTDLYVNGRPCMDLLHLENL